MIELKSYTDTILLSLNSLIVTDSQGQAMDSEAGLAKWCRMARNAKESNHTAYIVGNGASAMMASHMAADASKNGKIKCLAFNDPALMTAVSNDISYDECFALPLKRFASTGDILITISSSGTSPNIIKAIETAKEMDMSVVTLSGMKEDNRSRKMGDLNFYVPADTYGIVESSHQIILHCWLDRFIEETQKKQDA
ncbi:SIS domain-containing protein [Thermodesulfobacteriota bacterium]